MYIYPHLYGWNIGLICVIYSLLFLALPRLGWSRAWLVAAIPLDYFASWINSGLSNNPYYFILYPISCVIVVGILACSVWLHPELVTKLRMSAQHELLLARHEQLTQQLKELETFRKKQE